MGIHWQFSSRIFNLDRPLIFKRGSSRTARISFVLVFSSEFILLTIMLELKALKSSILIFLALVSLSPVLRTLTAATSSDSIWALSAILFTLNSLLADYSWSRSEQQGRER